MIKYMIQLIKETIKMTLNHSIDNHGILIPLKKSWDINHTKKSNIVFIK